MKVLSNILVKAGLVVEKFTSLKGASADYLTLNTLPSASSAAKGTVYWDPSQETAALIMNGTIQHVGQDTFYYVKNNTGSTIPKGTAVRFAGTDGNSGHLLIAPFIANGSTLSNYFMGVTSEPITNGGFGKVMHFGKLDGVNTSAYQDGDVLYASTTVAGGFQTTAPVAPNNIITIAAVVSAGNNGKIVVRPNIGSNINNDEGVRISNPQNNQVLSYNSSLGLWQNAAVVSNNIYNSDGTLTGARSLTLGGNSLDIVGSATTRFRSDGKITFGHTNAPVALFDFRGQSDISVYIDNTYGVGTRYGLIVQAQGSGGVGTNIAGYFNATYGAENIAIKADYGTVILNNASGNTLIGTSIDAGYKLDVVGTVRVGNNPSAMQLFVNGSTSTNGIFNSSDLYFTGPSRVVYSNGLIFNSSNNLGNSSKTYWEFTSQTPVADSGSGGLIDLVKLTMPVNNGTQSADSRALVIDFNVTTNLGVLTAIDAVSGKIRLRDLSGSGNRMVVADGSGVLSTQAIPTGNPGTVTSVALSTGTAGTDINVSGSPITSSGTFTLNIPSASTTARGVITTGAQTIAGQKTFYSGTTILDSDQPSTLLEGRAGGVLYGGVFFGPFVQFNAYPSATNGFLWKNGAGNNVMELPQSGDLRLLNLAGSGTRMVVADASGVLSTSTLPTSTNIYNSDGTLTANRTVNSGGFDLIFTGTDTASAGQARFMQLTPTLVAAANNDTLVGLDVNPTFTNGAFTGVKNFALRLGGSIRMPNNSTISTDDTSGITMYNGSTFVTLNNSAGIEGFLVAGNSTGRLFKVTRSGSAVFFLNENGNTIIGGTTDAGFRLDVNGTARVNGVLTLTSGGGITLDEGSSPFFNNTIRFSNFSGVTLQSEISRFAWKTAQPLAFHASLAGNSDLTIGQSSVRARGQIQVGNTDNTISNGFFSGFVLELGTSLTNSSAYQIRTVNPTTFPSAQNDLYIYGGVGSGNVAGDLFLQHNTSVKTGNVIIGTNVRTASAIVSIASTTQGFLPPRMTSTQRDAIATPAAGLQVYNSTGNTMDYYNGSSWTSFAAGNIYTADGTLISNRTVNSGGFDLIFTGTDTATAGQARFIQMTPTLVAAANNDVLVGLDISPTFTNGAFTNVANIGLRVSNSYFVVAGDYFPGAILPPKGLVFEASGGSARISSRFNSAAATLNINASTLGLSVGTINIPGGSITSTVGQFNQFVRTQYTAVSGGMHASFGQNLMAENDHQLYASSGRKLFISADNIVFSNQAAVTAAGQIFGTTGNWSIGGTTDAGFRLDVNGTARVQGALSVVAPTFAGTHFQLINANGVNAVSFGNNGNSASNGAIGMLWNGWSSGQPIYLTSSLPASVPNVNNAILIGGGAGSGNTLTNGSIRIGIQGNSVIGTNSISLGNFSVVTGASSIAISTTAFGVAVANVLNDNCFSIGSGVENATTANNQGILGVQNVFIGRPARSTSATGNTGNGTATSLNGMGGYGLTDATGGTLAINGGVGLGAGTPGNITFSTSSTTTSGTTIQTLTERMRVFGSTGNVLIQNGGTFTDAGFRLDVNGTARISSDATGRSFAATGNAAFSSGAYTVLDFQNTHGRLFSYNWTTATWLPVLMGQSRLVLSNSLGTRTEGLVGNTASFSGDVRMLSQATYIGPTENNGIFAPSTYSVPSQPAIENNSIGLIAGIGSVTNSAFIVASKINFQIGTGVNSKIAQFSPTTGNLILQAGGTFTDAGFRLDVNGTTRLNGNVTTGNTITMGAVNPFINYGNVGFVGSAAALIGGGTAGFGVRYGTRLVIGTGTLAYHVIGDNYALFSTQTAATDLSAGANESAVLEARSTTRGFLPPRMTAAQRTAIGTPAVGLIVYQTDGTEGLYENTSAGWRIVNAAGTGGVTDGNKGDITVSGGGATWTVNNAAITYAKIQNVADNRILGRSAGSAGTVQEIQIGSGLTLSGGTLSASGGSGYTVTTQSSNYTETATTGVRIIYGNTTGGSFTVTLPTAVGNSAMIIIKKTAGTAGLVIDGAGSETIDGGVTATLLEINSSITLVSNNSNWTIV